jgi:hypothetical protein
MFETYQGHSRAKWPRPVHLRHCTWLNFPVDAMEEELWVGPAQAPLAENGVVVVIGV